MLQYSTSLARVLLKGTSAGPCLWQLRTYASHPAAAHEKAPPQMPPFDYQPQPYVGPSKEEVLALRKKFLSPSELRACLLFSWYPPQVTCILLNSPCHMPHCACTTGMFHHFKEPVMITEGKMQYLFDERGRRYLDVSCYQLDCGASVVLQLRVLQAQLHG